MGKRLRSSRDMQGGSPCAHGPDPLTKLTKVTHQLPSGPSTRHPSTFNPLPQRLLSQRQVTHNADTPDRGLVYRHKRPFLARSA